MRDVARSLFVGFALMGIFSRQATGGEAGGANIPVRLPGGVADSDYKQGFVANASGGIDAIELQSGRLIWTAPVPGEPLIAWDDRLVAKTSVPDKPNSLRIVVLSIVNRGEKLLESDEISFPDWVSIAPAYGQSFSYQVQVANGAVLFKWEASSRYAGGAPPPPEVEAAATRDVSGLERIDLRSGRTESLPDANAWPRMPTDLPARFDDLASHPYWTGTSTQTRPLVVEDNVATLSWQTSEGQETLTLQRRDLETGSAIDDVVLARGEGLSATISLDGRHLLVRASQAGDGDERIRWRVFELASGMHVGTLVCESGTRAATVAGSRIYYAVVDSGQSRTEGQWLVQPQTLTAVDLATSRQLWQRPLEGLRTLRPLPPRP